MGQSRTVQVSFWQYKLKLLIYKGTRLHLWYFEQYTYKSYTVKAVNVNELFYMCFSVQLITKLEINVFYKNYDINVVHEFEYFTN